MSSTDIEKKSLEAHVELCAERYANLDTRLDNLETRMEKIEGLVIEVKEAIAGSGNAQNKQLITIGTSIIGVLLTAVIGLLTHLILK